MKRNTIAATLTLAFSIGFLAYILWPNRVPGIVHDLRTIPEVRRVDYSGPSAAALTVVHIRDWHFVPKNLADLEGLDYPKLLDQVENVHADQLAIVRYMIPRYGIKAVYSEGLSNDTMQGLGMRLDLLNDLNTLADAGKLDAAELAQRREIALTVGTPGRLLLGRAITTVKPLEDEQALQDAKPVAAGKIAPDEAKIRARRRGS